jgi:inorganic pyrophosphatase
LESKGFWDNLDQLIVDNSIVIDRFKGTVHPNFPGFIYQLDYGYIANTSSPDGHEIDVFSGSLSEKQVTGILCTLDLFKKDSEIKVLYACTMSEMQTLFEFFNQGPMKAVLLQKNTIAETV